MILTVIWATEPRTLDFYGFHERFPFQNFGSFLCRFSDIAEEVGIYGSSDIISCSMVSQRLTRLVDRKSLELYRVIELSRPLA